MRCGLLALFLSGLLMISTGTCVAAESDWPTPLVSIHDAMPLPSFALTIHEKRLTRWQRIKAGVARIPHPTVEQLNKFNTVAGVASFGFQVYMFAHNTHLIPF